MWEWSERGFGHEEFVTRCKGRRKLQKEGWLKESNQYRSGKGASLLMGLKGGGY